MGLHKMIETPEELLNLFLQYKTDVKSNPVLVEDYVGKNAERVLRQRERPLTMVGFEVFVSQIDGKPDTLDHYFSNKDNRYEDFIAICSRIRKEIQADQINGGMVGIYNPSITQRLNGLAEKQENKIEGSLTFLDALKNARG